MAEGVVHAVDTDDVDAEVFQVRDITGASSAVCQGVYEGGGLEEGVVGVISGLSWIANEWSVLPNSRRGERYPVVDRRHP
jgi:hypothetical protein